MAGVGCVSVSLARRIRRAALVIAGSSASARAD
jgi:hypothetical protein